MQVETFSVGAVETSAQAIQQWLVTQVAEQFNLDASVIDVRKPLTQYGLDSIIAFTIVGELEDWLEIDLPATLLWDSPTIEEATQYLVTLGLEPNNSKSL